MKPKINIPTTHYSKHKSPCTCFTLGHLQTILFFGIILSIALIMCIIFDAPQWLVKTIIIVVFFTLPIALTISEVATFIVFLLQYVITLLVKERRRKHYFDKLSNVTSSDISWMKVLEDFETRII